MFVIYYFVNCSPVVRVFDNGHAMDDFIFFIWDYTDSGVYRIR